MAGIPSAEASSQHAAHRAAGIPPAAAAYSPSAALAGSRDVVDLLRRLPAELRAMVLAHAGPLTAFLVGETPRPLTRTAFRLLVADCFWQDRVDVVRTLPPRTWLTCELLLVRSPAMRELALRFPRAADAGSFTGLDLGLRPRGEPPGPPVPCPDGSVLNGLADFVGILAGRESMPMLNALLDEVLAAVRRPLTRSFASRLLDCAAGLGRLDVVREVAAAAAMPFADAFDAAAWNGQTAVIEHLCARGLDRNVSMNGAVEAGRLRIVQWLRERYPALMPSAKSVHFALCDDATAAIWWLVRELVRQRGCHKEPVAEGTSGGGDASRAPPTPECFRRLRNLCAKFGHLDMLEFATQHDIGDALDQDGIDGAAENGHIDVVRWIAARTGMVCSVRGLDWAAENGHLATLQALHAEHGLMCSVRGLNAAAAQGRLETVAWIWHHLAQRRPPPVVDLFEPIANGHLWVVEFVLRATATDGSRGGSDGSAAHVRGSLNLALETGQLEIAKLIAASGRAVPRPAMLVGVAKQGHVECARWLVDALGDEMALPPLVVRHACRGNHAEMLEFLVRECGARVPESARTLAAQHGCDAVLAVIGSLPHDALVPDAAPVASKTPVDWGELFG
ncbi:hypothetical protein HK105_201053 [Polyrhizophydium stewartii]|uniref:Ankyrin repeat protein n=1 Tax=Polyrhizophydium stewartii TaxID=2732419 RepID=A0ABR4NIQ0_9FUNG